MYIVVIGWSSLVFKITWGIALFTTAVFRFTRSYSIRSSQKCKYTGGVVRRMRRCVVIQSIAAAFEISVNLSVYTQNNTFTVFTYLHVNCKKAAWYLHCHSWQNLPTVKGASWRAFHRFISSGINFGLTGERRPNGNWNVWWLRTWSFLGPRTWTSVLFKTLLGIWMPFWVSILQFGEDCGYEMEVWHDCS